MKMFVGIVIAILVIAALAFIVVRNRMVVLITRVDEAWGDIDVQLKRRHDLVPNLVTVVKAYAAHESSVVEDVTKAREAAQVAHGPAAAAAVEPALVSALATVMARAENYPQLKAATNFQQLSAELTELEDQIQASRRIYNSNVQIYNADIRTFPNLLVAGPCGYRPREFFGVTDSGDREPSNIQL